MASDTEGTTSISAEVSKFDELLVSFGLTPDPALFPDQLVAWAVRVLKPDICCYYQLDPLRQEFQRKASFPTEFWSQAHISTVFDCRPQASGALGRAAETVEVVVVDNPLVEAARGAYDPYPQPVAFEVLVPIVGLDSILSVRRTALAVLVLSWSVTPSNSVDLVSVARFVSHLASNVLNNALTATRRERHIAFLDRLTKLTAAPSSHHRSLYDGFLAGLAELAPTRFLSLWLHDSQNDLLVLRSFHPGQIDGHPVLGSQFDTSVLHVDTCVSGVALRTGRPFVATAARTEKRFANHNFAKEHGLSWFVSFPLINEDTSTPMGVINVWLAGPPLEHGDEAIDQYAAYVRYFAAAKQTSELMFQDALFGELDSFFSDLIRFEDSRRSWNQLATRIARDMAAEGCSIFISDERGLSLKGTTATRHNDAVVYASGEGLTGLVWQQGGPLLYQRETASRFARQHVSKYRELRDQSRSILLVPIKNSSSETIGVVRCVNKVFGNGGARTRSCFTTEDVGQLETIAAWLSSVYDKLALIRQKEEEQDRAFRSLHHEIIGPIDGILSHVDWIERHSRIRDAESWDMERLRLKLSDIKENSRLLWNVARALGPFNLAQSVGLRPIQLVALANTCLGFVVNDARARRIEIDIDGLYEVAEITADPMQMMTVFYNLLRNGLKYADPNESRRYIEFSASENSQTSDVTILIEDNGVGIPQGEEDVIFTKFKRGSNAADVAPIGEGLGLHYCREAMARQQGEISVLRNAKPTIFRLRMLGKKR